MLIETGVCRYQIFGCGLAGGGEGVGPGAGEA